MPDMDNIHFHLANHDMDIIDNYNQLMLGKWMEIQAVSQDESLEEIDKQAQIIAILTGQDVEEILHLPIGTYKDLALRASFLSGTMTYHPVSKKYLVGEYELIPVKDYRKIETCQYVDFQTYAPDLDKYLVEFLSVILVPKGHRYNEGYDILDVQRAIRERMSVSDGVSLAGFFLTLSRRSILNSLNYSREMAKGIKDKTKREKILQKIREQERLLGTNGDGSQM